MEAYAHDGPAGWNPDPWDPSGERWWDGTTWTHHVRQAPALPQAAPISGRRDAPAFLVVPTEATDEPARVRPPTAASQEGTVSRVLGRWLVPGRDGVEDEWRAAETSFALALIGLVNFLPLVALACSIAAIPVGMRGMHLAWRNRYLGGFVFGGAGILIGFVGIGLL